MNNNLCTIITEEGIQKGIFFRSPIQKLFFDAYYGDYPAISAWVYLKKIKNPIRRLYEILIGNGNIIKTIDQDSKRDDWGGFNANKLMCPIYFTRNYRSLIAFSTDEDSGIQKIESYGYEGPYNICAGACHIEYTTVTLKNGNKLKIKVRNYFKYTYAHIVESVFKSGKLNDKVH